MIAIIPKWHQAISWKLGYGHGTEERPYSHPWWVNEALYALAYTYAMYVEIPAVGERPSEGRSMAREGRRSRWCGL
jgi:hypothetical protein